MRELPPPDELLKPRDWATVIYVHASTWHCVWCDPDGQLGAGTTVVWLALSTDGPHGRCRECGQKYALGRPRSPHSGPGRAEIPVTGQTSRVEPVARAERLRGGER
jgi:hypothetical protein